MSRACQILLMFAASTLVMPLGACTRASTQEWTSLHFDGARVAVPVNWRLHWWRAGGVRWQFKLSQQEGQAWVGIMGADLSRSTLRDARAWLSWFSTRADDEQAAAVYHEYPTVEGTVVCVLRSTSLVFAACMRQPRSAEPRASAVVYVSRTTHELFDELGGLPSLVEIARRTQGFEYILCVRPRGELQRPGC